MTETVNVRPSKAQRRQFKFELTALGFLGLTVAFSIWLLHPVTETARVTGVHWSRSVDTERRVIRTEHGQQAWMPDDAFNISCHVERVECGSSRRRRYCNRTMCDYEHWVWEADGTFETNGNDTLPHWPNPRVDETHRIEYWHQTYTLTIGGRLYSEDHASLLTRFRLGDEVTYRRNHLGLYDLRLAHARPGSTR